MATPVSATTTPDACQTTARPSASTTMQTTATLAPPIRSGRCPNAIRVTMNVTLNVVSASQAWLQPRSRNSNGTKVVIAAKPTPLKAKATPGRHIARTIAERGGAAAALGGVRRNGTTNPIVASGRSIVATPTAANPLLAYRPLPAGAPIAYAVYSAVPTHDITVPVCLLPARASPQLSAPVMTKLSMTPRSVRPSSSSVTDVLGAAESRTERM